MNNNYYQVESSLVKSIDDIKAGYIIAFEYNNIITCVKDNLSHEAIRDIIDSLY